jgi:hypothetical protein
MLVKGVRNMGVWSRSWTITRASFAIIGKDKEMLWFPILAGIFSLLFSATLLVPTIVLKVLEQTGHGRVVVGPMQIVALFVTYFGLSFIATFFNVCVVNTTRVRLSGGDATFMDSIKFALSRIHLILGWSLLSASVGLFLHFLDELAQRSGLLGKILLSILRSILASAWAITTIFVVPAMVYKGLGPFDAIKESVATLRKAWGESLLRHYGLGLAMFVCLLPCFLLVVAGVATLGSAGAAGIALIGFGVVALVGVALVFGVANSVFNTILYHWATTGSADGIEPEVLSGAFRVRG